jgi:parvulin-like peptidyl-prolyl isomerase
MNKMSKLLIFSVIILAALFVSAEEVVEAIVAVVNDDYISLSDYKKTHDLYYQVFRSQLQGEEFTKQYKEFKANLMDMMITELLLLQEAQKMGIDVTEQVKAQIERFKEQNGITSDEQLKQALNQQNMTFEKWRQDIEEQLLRQGVLFSEVGRGIIIDDSELVGYYNQNRELFRVPDEYTLKAIYVSSGTRSEEEVEARKDEILEKIHTGEDMSALAEEYGEGPEKDNQGDLGTLKKGEMAPNLEQAVEALQVGELTPWIEMPGGWYLLRLEEKTESRIRTFEEVRDEIEARLYQQKNDVEVEKYLRKLKERSYIKILIPNPLEIR